MRGAGWEIRVDVWDMRYPVLGSCLVRMRRMGWMMGQGSDGWVVGFGCGGYTVV